MVKVRQWYRGQTRGKAVADLHPPFRSKPCQNHDKNRPSSLCLPLCRGTCAGANHSATPGMKELKPKRSQNRHNINVAQLVRSSGKMCAFWRKKTRRKMEQKHNKSATKSRAFLCSLFSELREGAQSLYFQGFSALLT